MRSVTNTSSGGTTTFRKLFDFLTRIVQNATTYGTRATPWDDSHRMESRRKNSGVHKRATLFGDAGVYVFVGHCDVAHRWPEGKGTTGIAFSDGSFPQSKLLGCHSNWPGNEQSALLPDICQRYAALYGSRVTSLFFSASRGTPRTYDVGSCRKGYRPLAIEFIRLEGCSVVNLRAGHIVAILGGFRWKLTPATCRDFD